MKSPNLYLNTYFDFYNLLNNKNELQLLKITPDEYLNKIEIIRSYCDKLRETSNLTKYHIDCIEKEMVSRLIFNYLDYDTVKANLKLTEEVKLKKFKEDRISAYNDLKDLKNPLEFGDILRISFWLSQKVITLEILSKEIFEEYIESSFFLSYINGLKS